LPWRYDAEMGIANSLRASGSTASIMKGLILEYLTRNNQGRRQKNFQEGAIEKKNNKKTSNSVPSVLKNRST